MASSLIAALTVTTPYAVTAPTLVTDGERKDLLAALTKVPDPRDPRGIRCPLSAVLTVAVRAVMAGACSFAAITDWLHDLDDQARTRLGFTDGVPAGTTMCRLLIHLDPALLATVLAGWLHARTQQPRVALPRRYLRVIVVDGETLRGAKTSASRRLIALDRHTVRLLREHRRRQRAQQRAAGEGWQDSGYVLVAEDGAPLHPDFLTRRFRHPMLESGLPQSGCTTCGTEPPVSRTAPRSISRRCRPSWGIPASCSPPTPTPVS
ncbi:transposase family protein [Paractinoplanes maris]|uniref:transposase family protein n=1 Tax=Paractinoplanes maris TaxID=1734446 RepID=UPI00202217CC|nr:transposase family protein [Actinoplanes maris]